MIFTVLHVLSYELVVLRVCIPLIKSLLEYITDSTTGIVIRVRTVGNFRASMCYNNAIRTLTCITQEIYLWKTVDKNSLGNLRNVLNDSGVGFQHSTVMGKKSTVVTFCCSFSLNGVQSSKDKNSGENKFGTIFLRQGVPPGHFKISGDFLKIFFFDDRIWLRETKSFCLHVVQFVDETDRRDALKGCEQEREQRSSLNICANTLNAWVQYEYFRRIYLQKEVIFRKKWCMVTGPFFYRKES